ncbi:MAG TPA: beta-propeller fold lactonase family protein [Kofleriaceae bacterium]|jgi:YVTN family beta-propeller protein
MQRFMVVAALVLVSCSKGKAVEERVYVSDEDGGTVVVISAVSDEVVARIPVGKRPRGVRISPDGARLFVALSGVPKMAPGADESKAPPADPTADGVGIVDLASLKLLRTVPAGKDPEVVDVTGDGKRLWVSNEDAAEASLVDIDAGKVLRTVPVGKEPEGVTIHPGGKVVYVSNEADNTVSVLDIETGQSVAQIAVGGRPRSIAFTGDGARGFVACETAHGLTLVDATRHIRTGDLDLPGDPLIRPMGLVIAGDGRTLYATTGRGKAVYAIALDEASPRVKATIPDVGVRPWGIGITRKGDKLYTANGPTGDVSVIDVATGAVSRHIAVGGSPWGIAVH